MFEATHGIPFAILAVEGERLQQIAGELNRPVSWSEIGLLGLFMGLAPLVAWLLFRRFGSAEPVERAAHPKALFHELCDGHDLGREERELLEQLAKRANLDPLARMFLEPDRVTDPQSSELRPSQRLLLTALNVKLFGSQPLTVGSRFAETAG